jgi:hypothetical protein
VSSSIRELMDAFTSAEIQTGETSIFVRSCGSGPPLLLLHGFPQTHLMWHRVAPQLARNFTVVCADLRGYDRSGCPDSAPDHAPYAKRAMAQDMVTRRSGHRADRDRLGARRREVRARLLALVAPGSTRTTPRAYPHGGPRSDCRRCAWRMGLSAGRVPHGGACRLHTPALDRFFGSMS